MSGGIIQFPQNIGGGIPAGIGIGDVNERDGGFAGEGLAPGNGLAGKQLLAVGGGVDQREDNEQGDQRQFQCGQPDLTRGAVPARAGMQQHQQGDQTCGGDAGFQGQATGLQVIAEGQRRQGNRCGKAHCC